MATCAPTRRDGNCHLLAFILGGFHLKVRLVENPGVTILIGSITCFALAVRKQRKDCHTERTMASDCSVNADADVETDAVMRT